MEGESHGILLFYLRRHSGGTAKAHEGGGCDRSIGFTVSDAIVLGCGRLQLGIPIRATSVEKLDLQQASSS